MRLARRLKRKFFNGSLALSAALCSPLVDTCIDLMHPSTSAEHSGPRDTAVGHHCITDDQRKALALSQLY